MSHNFFSLPFLLCSILFFITILKLVIRSFRSIVRGRKVVKLPPGPWRLPIIGSVHHLGGSLPHRRMRELSEKYGPLIHLQMGGMSTVVVSSAETAKQVLKTKDHIFGQRPLLSISDVLFYGPSNIVMSPTGDYWKLIRKICSHQLLNATRVRSFQSVREEEASSLMRCLYAEAGSPVNLTQKIFATACRIASRSAFGENNIKHDNGREEEAMMWLCDAITSLSHGISDLFPSQKWLQVVTGARRRYEELRQKMDVVLENIIADHDGAAGGQGGEEEKDCLLTVLLNLERRGDLTIDNVKAVILDVILGAFEPASRLVEWAMAEMVRKPTIMKRAQEEVRQVFKTKGYIDETSIEELEYLKGVIKETLRLHPPAPLLAPRECTKTCEISGFTIPKGTQVLVNVWAIGRDSKYWNSSSSLSDAEEFVPERFMNSCVDYRGSNFEYIPFGAGKRVCPGMLFGPVVGEILLANLLCYFDWDLPSGTTPKTLDMTELMGSTVRKKDNLILIPIPHRN
ncbi:cytochrome P450 71D11-like [Prosopis cineraria]|uniref:cytochrome P450 71D11-like n=1 Tax=Prosopis cineraria TaxID=364024 RepID=UPI00240F0903|nr:cytochrome P450 71D11-like [Prosopis cineraria]